MKDKLCDIVKHVSVLPFDIIKVTGTDGKVILQSKLQDDKFGNILFSGELKGDTPEFEGIFGLMNIPMLSGLLNVPAFGTDKRANISMKYLERNDIKIPEEFLFQNPEFGKASYRLTAEKAIPTQAKQTGAITWDVTFEPTTSKVNDFAQLSTIYASQESKFGIKTEDKNLKFMIGDEGAATSKAQINFASDIVGDIKSKFTWGISPFLNILKLNTTDKITIQISNQGILRLEADSGFGTYSYLLFGAS